MTVHSLYIINKAGGLIYNKDFSEGLAKLTSNEYLVLAGTFHGIHALTARISPIPGSSGLEVLEADTFKLCCFQTLTGIKILLCVDPNQPSIDIIMKRVYELYSDFAVKNPFYTQEMPIRCELFDTNMARFMKQLNGL